MAEEINPAENAENLDSVVESTPAQVEEKVSQEEPIELYSTADDAAYMTSTGEFNWDAYEAAGGYTKDERSRYDEVYEKTLSTITEKKWFLEPSFLLVKKKLSSTSVTNQRVLLR